MQKDTKIYLTLVIIVLLIIAGIYYYKNMYNPPKQLEEETMKCIASKAVMYSQTSCSHCITQKELLGDYKDLFTIVECDKDLEACSEQGITGTPTWIINNQKITSLQSIEKLKELTKC